MPAGIVSPDGSVLTHWPLVAAMIVAAPQAPAARRLLESAPLRLLGVVSFGLYVYHMPCLRLTARVLRRAGIAPSRSWALLAGAGLALSVLVPAGSYLLVERAILRRSAHRRLPSQGAQTR